MKTSELTGDALNWAVAKAEGHKWRLVEPGYAHYARADTDCWYTWNPAVLWAQGGPIIEREQIFVLPPTVRRIGAERHAFPTEYWRAMIRRDDDESALHGYGGTPLVAAMRCYVVSRLGPEVELPEELQS